MQSESELEPEPPPRWEVRVEFDSRAVSADQAVDFASAAAESRDFSLTRVRVQQTPKKILMLFPFKDEIAAWDFFLHRDSAAIAAGISTFDAWAPRVECEVHAFPRDCARRYVKCSACGWRIGLWITVDVKDVALG